MKDFNRIKPLIIVIGLVAVIAWIVSSGALSGGSTSSPNAPPSNGSPQPSASASPIICRFVSVPETSFTEIVSLVKQSQISCAVTQGNSVSITLVDGTYRLVKVTPTKDFIEMLSFYGVTAEQINKINYYSGGLPPASFMDFLPMLFLFGILGFFAWSILRARKMQQQGPGGGKQLEDKSKRDPAGSSDSKNDSSGVAKQERITFADVAGVDEAKMELQEQVEFLKNPEKFAAAGAEMPKGVLLIGPPGTGKTLLARAVAGEAGVPFFSMNGSEFIEMFVGVGAKRVRELFGVARKNAPCIVFIDEIDSIGRKRTSGLGSGGESEQHQTINQILAEMDGFDKDKVVVIAATNRVDVLDAAILRPGRFTRHVVVDRPDLKGREAILNIYLKNKKLEKGVTALNIAKRTPGFTGADLKNILNEAAIFATRRDSVTISNQDINNAIDRVIAGSEKKTLLLSEEEKNIIAHHECGHAVVRYLASNGAMIPNKISVVSRGSALGLTWYIPDRDVVLYRKSELKFELAGTIGGYVAEDILLNGDITTGPGSDLEKLTELARNMITKYAMSDTLPTRLFVQDNQTLVSTDSQETKARVDAEIEALVADAKKTAKTIIEENRKGFLGLVNQLRKEEIIADEQLLEAFILHFPDHEASLRAREKLALLKSSNEEVNTKE